MNLRKRVKIDYKIKNTFGFSKLKAKSPLSRCSIKKKYTNEDIENLK